MKCDWMTVSQVMVRRLGVKKKKWVKTVIKFYMRIQILTSHTYTQTSKYAIIIMTIFI